MSFVSLLGPFGALGLSFGTLGPSFGAFGPQVGIMTPRGGNWGRIRGPNRSAFWASFSYVFVNKLDFRLVFSTFFF